MADQQSNGNPPRLPTPLFRFPELLAGPQRPLTHLYVIGLFCALAEILFFIIFTQTLGSSRDLALVAIVAFPFVIVIGYYLIVYRRPEHLMTPSDFQQQPTAIEFSTLLTQRQTHPVSENLAQGISRSMISSEVEFGIAVPKEDYDVAAVPGEALSDTPHWIEFLLPDDPTSINFDKAEEAFAREQQTKTDITDRLAAEIRYRYLRFTRGDQSSLEKLSQLADQAASVPSIAAQAQINLGLAFLAAGGPRKAEAHFRQAAENAITPFDKTLATGFASSSLRRQGSSDDAFQMMKTAIAETVDDAALAWLYRQLAGFFKADGDQFQQAIALEKALEIEPADIDVRVDAGIAYSSSGLHSVSLLHNTRALEIAPANSWALNNLGVDYQFL